MTDKEIEDYMNAIAKKDIGYRIKDVFLISRTHPDLFNDKSRDFLHNINELAKRDNFRDLTAKQKAWFESLELIFKKNIDKHINDIRPNIMKIIEGKKIYNIKDYK